MGHVCGRDQGAVAAGGATNEDLISIVQSLGSYAGMNARPFSLNTPTLDVRLQDGSRLAALMSATQVPIVSIRRNRYPQMFLRPDMAQAATTRGRELLPDLVSLGTVDQQVADFLHAAVRSRCNVVVGGATDAGKTALLRALINCIEVMERLLTIEIALELGIDRHPELHLDVVPMEVVLPDAEGRGGLDIAELVRRTRRHNPSRVIVGEVLGPEVVEMLSAMSQGNDGSLSTIHARDSEEVFNRVATYAAQLGNMNFDIAHQLMAGAIDFVVFIEKNPMLGMRRTVTQIIEVSGVMNPASSMRSTTSSRPPRRTGGRSATPRCRSAACRSWRGPATPTVCRHGAPATSRVGGERCLN